MQRCLRWAAFLVAISLRSTDAVCQPATDPDRLAAQAEAYNAKGAYRETLALVGPLHRDAALQPRQRALLLCHLGTAQAALAQYDAALGSAGDAERLAASDAELLARVELVRGAVTRVRPGPMRAIGHYEKAVRFGETAGRPSVVAAAYDGLASASQALGDWSRVLYYAQRSWEANPRPDPLGRHRYAVQRGIASFEFGDLDAAEQSFKEALTLAEKAGNRHGISLSIVELGLVYAGVNPAAALEHFERAIAVAREIGVPDLEVVWLSNSGSVVRDSGDLTGALRHFHRALDLERKTGQQRSLPVLLKNIGQTLLRNNQLAEAEPYLLDALAQADRQNAWRPRWEARMELGTLYSRSDAAKAERYFAESLDTIEQHHSSVLLEGFRVGAMGRSLTQYDPYDLYIEFLLDRGETARAFVVAERARARAFLDTLASAREQIAAAAPPAFIDAESDLLQQISLSQTLLRSGPSDVVKRDATIAEIAKAEEALTALRLKLATEQPALAQARYPRIWSIDDLRALLGDDEVLYEVFLGRRASAGWIIRKDGLDVVRLPARSTIEEQARRYLQGLRSPTADDRVAAAALFDSLALDRVTAVAQGRRLVTVPHGILNYLPFESLVTPRGRYLIEERAVSYAPSASSFAFLRNASRARAARAGIVMAVGDPMLEPDRGTRPEPAERGLSVDRVDLLKPLPYVAEELQRVAAIFRRGARTFVREEATEDRLSEDALDDASILHIATHGLIDEQRPERSALALTARPPTSDGILQMREVYRLKLRASLVTLSACQTALGRDVTGEGIVGLSRAFFYAGANAVMASLWNVNDASTAQFMTSFYGGIRQGDSIDLAARNAKLEFIRSDDARLRHPYYWAAFTVSGHAAVSVPIRGVGITGTAWMAAAAVTATVGVGWFIVRRRRKAILKSPVR